MTVKAPQGALGVSDLVHLIAEYIPDDDILKCSLICKLYLPIMGSAWVKRMAAQQSLPFDNADAVQLAQRIYERYQGEESQEEERLLRPIPPAIREQQIFIAYAVCQMISGDSVWRDKEREEFINFSKQYTGSLNTLLQERTVDWIEKGSYPAHAFSVQPRAGIGLRKGLSASRKVFFSVLQ